MKIELNQEELNALVALLDVGVKASGLQSVKLATVIVGKLEAASKAASEEEVEE